MTCRHPTLRSVVGFAYSLTSGGVSNSRASSRLWIIISSWLSAWRRLTLSSSFAPRPLSKLMALGLAAVVPCQDHLSRSRDSFPANNNQKKLPLTPYRHSATRHEGEHHIYTISRWNGLFLHISGLYPEPWEHILSLELISGALGRHITVRATPRD